MDILGSLGTLANNVKNITLPGIIAALAFALLIWPPHTYDRVPAVIDNKPDIAKLELQTKLFALDPKSYGDYLAQSGAACTIKEGGESSRFLTIPDGYGDRAAAAVKNQLVLDDIDRTLKKCIEEETALQGLEDQAIKNLSALIAARTAVRDAINAQYQKYVLEISPLTKKFAVELKTAENGIADLQVRALNLQRAQGERTRRLSQLQRLETEMQQRLGEAGRLRPVQKFDDILSGLSNHIVAFLMLVFAWGLLIDPINRAVFSIIYDRNFDNAWDAFRTTRETPGQDIYDRWWEDEAAPLGGFSRPTAIALVLVGLAVGAFLIACCCMESRVTRITATAVCATPVDDGVTLSATVIAPGSEDVPTGEVEFFDGNQKLGNAIGINKQGEATGAVPVVKAGDHKLTAKYSGGLRDYDATSKEISAEFRPSDSEVLVEKIPVPMASQAQTASCGAYVPDLRHPPLASLCLTFALCCGVTLIGFGIARLVPTIFTQTPERTEDKPEKPDKDEVDAFRTAAKEGASEVTITHENWSRRFIENLAKYEVKKPVEEELATRETVELEGPLQIMVAELANKLSAFPPERCSPS